MQRFKNALMEALLTKSLTKPVGPLEIRQAVVGLELGITDQPLLRYLDFFASVVPVSSVYFVHVLPKYELFQIAEEAGQAATKSFVHDTELEFSQRMETGVNHFFPQGENIFVEFDVRTGDPLEEVLHDTEEFKADLIVIGQKSDAGWHGILARNLVRKTTCPSLVVPQNAEVRLNSILVPVDFSPNSIRALHYALSMKKRLGSALRVTCLHVYEQPPIAAYRINHTQEDFRHMLEMNIQDGFAAFLHTYAKEFANEIEHVVFSLDEGSTSSCILKYAAENFFDLITIGAKGHTRVELLLIGSVTEKLMNQNENIPVLIIK
jgi:nucleotide-binding universal stress UspA family protein